MSLSDTMNLAIEALTPPIERNIVRIDGVPVDVLSEHQAIQILLTELDNGRGGVVATPNIDHLRLYRNNADVRRGYERADLSLADGMPLVWASRLRGTPLPERVAGSDLTVSLAASAARAGRSVYLLGGNPGVAETAAGVLVHDNPGLKIAGTYCPPYKFEQDQAAMARVRQLLSKSGPPDIVYIGVSFPRSLAISHELHKSFPSTWFLGIGISLSFISGEVTRAPRWMSAIGLEWLHRFGQEPRRLARRYLLHGIPFGIGVIQRAVRARFSR